MSSIHMQTLIDSIRYAKWFSMGVRKPSRFISRAAKTLNEKIKSAVKINSGVVTYYGHRLIYPDRVGIGALSNLYWNGEVGFEATNGKVLIALFKRSAFFYDIGSNYGFYSVLAQKANTSIQIHAFEPNEEMAIQNKRFAVANNIKHDLDQRGLSDKESDMNFFVPQKDGLKEVTTATLNSDFFFNKNRNTKTVTIHCTTLDSVWAVDSQKTDNVPNAGVMAPRIVVKIDVEGHEKSVIAGAWHFISSARPVIVCEIEMQIQSSEWIFRSMEEFKYRIFHLQPLGLVRLARSDFSSDFGKHRDFLFLPQEFDASAGENFIPTHRIDYLLGPLSGTA
jgi:FkbM family methyltransferase